MWALPTIWTFRRTDELLAHAGNQTVTPETSSPLLSLYIDYASPAFIARGNDLMRLFVYVLITLYLSTIFIYLITFNDDSDPELAQL